MNRFNDPGFFPKMFKTFLMQTFRIVTVPITAVARYIRSMTSGETIARKAAHDVTDKVKDLSKPPETIDAYVDTGSHYVAKILIYLLVLLLLLLPSLFINFAWPPLQARFFTRTMPIDSADIEGYSGKVRLTDRLTKTVLYEGKLDNGRINGFGHLYDYQGKKHYDGNFQMELYQGYGILYNEDGSVKYQGDFVKNLYDGEGILYYPDGTVKYEGSFKNGLYEGNGMRKTGRRYTVAVLRAVSMTGAVYLAMMMGR